MESAKYRNLRSLLQWDRERAKATVLRLQQDSKQIIEDIEDEMIRLHGFKWKIWTGFHAVPSMEHLHMHIISSDFISPSLKNKKHYNSFHPKLGFFLHLHDVLEWFEGDDEVYQSVSSNQSEALTRLTCVSKQMSRLPSSEYERLLKEDLSCWRCKVSQKNIPTLKAHLEVEWKREQEKAILHQKRKRVEEDEEDQDGEDKEKDDDTAKKQRVGGEEEGDH
ncbi:hypothetical protein FRC18_008114 [Serendipita sp. 400]|nr:hypothetical protein FRC18_008114 [Serendipita sp. 400]